MLDAERLGHRMEKPARRGLHIAGVQTHGHHAFDRRQLRGGVEQRRLADTAEPMDVEEGKRRRAAGQGIAEKAELPLAAPQPAPAGNRETIREARKHELDTNSAATWAGESTTVHATLRQARILLRG